MRRIMIVSMLVSMLLWTASFTYADQVCWRLQDGLGTPLLDLLRCSYVFGTNTNPLIVALNCSDEADPLYHAVGAGTATNDVEVDFTKYRIGLSLVHTAPGFFGNNRVGIFTALINTTDPDYLDGTWSMQWAGGPGAPFNVSGLLVFFACPATLAQVQQEQKAMLVEQGNTFGEARAAGIGNFVTLEQP